MSQWNKKAKNYARYDEDEQRFEAKILRAVQELHVDIKGKKIIDIGCGTGVYTLRIAASATHVVGVDSAGQMLEILKEDAKKLNITNISTNVCSWDNYILPQEKYDIAICTMSPAVSNKENYQKMAQCADTKIYLGWAGKRSSAILEAIFEAHGETYNAPNGAASLENWLIQEKIAYKILPFEEHRESQKDFEAAVQNFAWHLEVRGVTPNHSKIKSVLKSLLNTENQIVESIHSHMHLILW